MIDDAERLSRLLAEDLPPDEAAVLRERIAHEPALAALWSTMVALPQELEALPALPAGAQRPRRKVPRRQWWPIPAIAAAALVGLLLGRFTAPPALIQFPSGQLALRGTAALQQESPMKSRTAAAAGVTVALVAGTAWFTTPDGVASSLTTADAPVTVIPLVAAPTVLPERVPAAPAQPDPLVERLQFENTLLRGALKLHEGEPQAFPGDYPAELMPQGFEATVRPLVEVEEDLELTGVDCMEYPCVAWVEAAGEPEVLWSERLATLKGRFERRDGWGSHWIWTFPYVQKDQLQSRAMVGIMIHPGTVPPGVAKRLQHRVELTMEMRIQDWNEGQ